MSTTTTVEKAVRLVAALERNDAAQIANAYSHDVSLLTTVTAAATNVSSWSGGTAAAPPPASFTVLDFALHCCKPDAVHALLSQFLQHSRGGAEALEVSRALTNRLFPAWSIAQEVPSSSGSPSPSSSPAASEPQEQVFERVERAIAAIAAGQFVVVMDEEDRENECDLIIAAEKVTAEKMAFMVNETSGIICVGITAQRALELDLPQMVEHNTESHRTAFTVSVDYKHGGVTTGISAHDRAATIRSLADAATKPSDLARPGHIFPLRARDGGLLERGGHTEASVDLARMAGLAPAGVLCEIVNHDGSMKRPARVHEWAARRGLICVKTVELIAYRRAKQ